MSKLALYGVLGLAVLIIGAAVYAWIYRQGGDAERVAQEKENAQFQVQANKGRVSYDTCDAADGLYDFYKGTCQLPTARPNP